MEFFPCYRITGASVCGYLPCPIVTACSTLFLPLQRHLYRRKQFIRRGGNARVSSNPLKLSKISLSSVSFCQIKSLSNSVHKNFLKAAVFCLRSMTILTVPTHSSSDIQTRTSFFFSVRIYDMTSDSNICFSLKKVRLFSL